MFGRGKETEAGVRRTRDTWFGRVASLFQGPTLDDALWDELEELLIAADVGMSTTVALIDGLKERVRREGITQSPAAKTALKQEMVHLLQDGNGRGPWKEGETRPHVILMVGVNGTGKTTSIAKLALAYRKRGKRVVLAAADTFRAAAIDQLQVWGQRVGADVVAHRHGGDPGAVAFDAYQAALARGADVLIVDTAGRLHTKVNLMEELKKVRRVLAKTDPSAPHEVLLVLDATTGQNALIQARHFTEAVGVTGVFLAKLDGTAKGGIVLAIVRGLGLPIRYIGTGEGAEDMAEFDAETFVEALFA